MIKHDADKTISINAIRIRREFQSTLDKIVPVQNHARMSTIPTTIGARKVNIIIKSKSCQKFFIASPRAT